MRFDAFTVEVMWNRLVTISEEAENALVKTSFSTVISEAHDFACLIMDENATSLAQSPRAVPGFTLTLPQTASHCLQVFPPRELSPGDVLVTNDPWMGSGHLSDLNLIRPIFYDERYVGLLGVVGHVSDIGGVIGYHTGLDVFEEGLRIPISKLYSAGVVDNSLLSFVRSNVRAPELVIGDIIGMASALEVGHSGVVEFLEDSGLKDLRGLSAELRDRSSSAMARVIATLPDGRYEGTYTFDGYEEPVRLVAAVTIDNDTIEVDYAGTDAQLRAGAINAPFIISRAETFYCFQYMLAPGVPTCSALFDSIAVRAPRGSILNPDPPASVKARSKTTFHIPEVLFRALAPAVPDRVQAASGHSCYVIINGQDAMGNWFNSYYLPGGGMGASKQQDGLDCTLFPTNTTVTPLEALENTAPIVIEEKRLRPDSGGAGKHRGGTGQRVVLRSISQLPLAVTLRPEDRRCPPTGLLGGQAGAASDIHLNGRPCFADLLEMQPGDELTIDLPGGGGFGQPLERSADAVRLDVLRGTVSVAGALRDYGVAIDPETFEVQHQATREKRAETSRVASYD